MFAGTISVNRCDRRPETHAVSAVRVGDPDPERESCAPGMFADLPIRTADPFRPGGAARRCGRARGRRQHDGLGHRRSAALRAPDGEDRASTGRLRPDRRRLSRATGRRRRRDLPEQHAYRRSRPTRASAAERSVFRSILGVRPDPPADHRARRCWSSSAPASFAFTKLNIEAYPNPAPVILEITAQAPGLSAEEMEKYYTIPMEIGALPDARAWSTSARPPSTACRFVRVTFKYGVDYYFAYTQAALSLQQNVNLAGQPGAADPAVEPGRRDLPLPGGRPAAFRPDQSAHDPGLGRAAPAARPSRAWCRSTAGAARPRSSRSRSISRSSRPTASPCRR